MTFEQAAKKATNFDVTYSEVTEYEDYYIFTDAFAESGCGGVGSPVVVYKTGGELIMMYEFAHRTNDDFDDCYLDKQIFLGYCQTDADEYIWLRASDLFDYNADAAKAYEQVKNRFKISRISEHEDAWYFYYDDGVREIDADNGIVVQKDSYEENNPWDYFMGTATFKSDDALEKLQTKWNKYIDIVAQKNQLNTFEKEKWLKAAVPIWIDVEDNLILSLKNDTPCRVEFDGSKYKKYLEEEIETDLGRKLNIVVSMRK